MGPRILVIHPYPDLYGADRVLLDAVTALRDAGFKPTIVLPEPGPMTAWLDERGLPYQFVDTPVLRRALLNPAGILDLARTLPACFRLVARTLSALEADLVYVNTITLPHWVAGARHAQIPCIVHVHESDDRMNPAIAAALAAPLLAADRIIAVSRAVESFLSHTYSRLADRIVVVHNGLSSPSGDFEPALAGPTAQLVVIGRLSPNKGQDLAIAAVRSLVRDGRDVRLELAGSAFRGAEEYEHSLRRAVVESDLADRVLFGGYCEDVWGLLRRTDIVLAPSRTDSLPLVVMQAMMAARPVVAADVGGMRELLEHGRSGLLVRPNDVDSLSREVSGLLDDPLGARQLGKSARLRAEDRFSSERFRREIVENVQCVLETARSPKKTVRRSLRRRRASRSTSHDSAAKIGRSS